MSPKPVHTPGPWEIVSFVGDGRQYIRSESNSMFTVAEITSDVLPEIEFANARLMAAAPDLLAALEECDVAFATINIGRDHGITPQADAAMRKAWERLWEARTKALGGINHFAEANKTAPAA